MPFSIPNGSTTIFKPNIEMEMRKEILYLDIERRATETQEEATTDFQDLEEEKEGLVGDSNKFEETIDSSEGSKGIASEEDADKPDTLSDPFQADSGTAHEEDQLSEIEKKNQEYHLDSILDFWLSLVGKKCAVAGGEISKVTTLNRTNEAHFTPLQAAKITRGLANFFFCLIWVVLYEHA
ncbi:hypothetical protein ACJX0J_017720 [Zea mays]